MPSTVPRQTWGGAFDQWLAPFLSALRDKRRQRWAPLYIRGLIDAGERKSIAPVAARLAPEDYQQLHHFVSGATWETAPLERVLASKADELVGGEGAVLIVDDTALLKQGQHSVGVGHQYAGQVGKTTNCQVLVSLTLAREEVPLCVGLRLFLPQEWTDDPERCRRAGVPEDRIAFRKKGEIALDEIDRLRSAGVRFGCVLADTGYGTNAAFRQGLSERGLRWAVGIPRIQKFYPPEVELLPPTRKKRSRPPTHPTTSHARETAEAMLADVAWQMICWREGTRGPLQARFAALRVRVADGPINSQAQHLPGEGAWLVGEERSGGERRYYLTNHPIGTDLRTLASAIKGRWSCEQAHQQMKEELGLDHFEGRSHWGLHRHALLCMISLAFLQHLRLGEHRRREKNEAGRSEVEAGDAAEANAASRATHGDSSLEGHTPEMPDLPKADLPLYPSLDLAK